MGVEPDWGPQGARGAAAAAPRDGAERRPLLMRKVEVAALGPDGAAREASRLVPAAGPFEEAFAAFARGTLFPTPRGPVAVEDLWPGMPVRVASGAVRRLLWRGSATLVPPRDGVDPAMSRLTRVGADSLGLARPVHDLVLGPSARLARRGPGVRALTGQDAASIPAADLVDGVNVVSILPPAPVQVFHLGFERHERLLASGVEVESQHPGPLHAFPLKGEMLQLWLACFPHRAGLGAGLAAWGEPALPRLRLRDLDLFDA